MNVHSLALAVTTLRAALICASLTIGTDARGVTPLNHIVNDRADDPPGRVQSEVSLAVHGETIVVVWNDATGYYEDASMCGYGVSLDGGATWNDGGELPNAPSMRIAGDPWTVSTPDGEVIVASVDTGNDDGIAIHRGRVVGSIFVWDAPSTYVRSGGEALDKPAIDYDPATGALYLAYVNWSQNRGELARSDDRGRSWHEPIVIFESSRATGYTPVAGIDGGVYVSWVERIGEPSARLHIRHSADGGRSWEDASSIFATLGPRAHEPPLGYDRTVNATFPSLAVDRSHAAARGRLVAAWTDGEPGAFDVFVSTSNDRGHSWFASGRVRDGAANGDAFWPSVCIGDGGRVVVGWYDRRHALPGGSTTSFHVTESLDGGVTFGPDHEMSDASVPWEGVPSDFTPNFGDYIDVALDDHTVYAAWSDARAGDPDVIVARRLDRLPIHARVAGDASDHLISGTAWTLANEVLLGVAADATDASAALVTLPLALLASTDDVEGVLPSTGGSATGTLRVDPVAPSGRGALPGDAGRTVIVPFHIDAPDQIGTPRVRPVVLQVTVPPIPTLATRGGGEAHRWETTLRVEPVTLDTLSVSGVVTTAHGSYSITGDVGLAAPGSSGAEGWTIEQSGWREGGNLRTRARVHRRDIAAPPLTCPAALGEAGAVSRGSLGTALRIAPNPISPETRVHITGEDATGAAVRIYDVRGRWCRTLTAEVSGETTRSIRFDAGDTLAPGIYVVRLESPVGEVLATSKIVVGP